MADSPGNGGGTGQDSGASVTTADAPTRQSTDQPSQAVDSSDAQNGGETGPPGRPLDSNNGLKTDAPAPAKQISPDLGRKSDPKPQSVPDASEHPQDWGEDETIEFQPDQTPNAVAPPAESIPGERPEVEAARAGVAEAFHAGERQQEARDAVNAAYAQAEADGVPPNTIERFEADAQQAIDDAPSTTGAKEVEFKEPGPAKEVEFQDPGIAEEKAATPEAIPEPRLQDGLIPEQPAEGGVPEGVPDRSDSQGGDASTPSGDAHPGNSDDWNANDNAIGTPDASNQGDAVAHSDASDAAMFDSQVDACVHAADEVGASREAWDGMSVDERANTLKDLEASMADATGRPGADVSFESLPDDTWGYFDPNTNDMVINADKLADPKNFGELVDTVAHEGRHAYQDFALKNPAIHGDAEQLTRWAENAAPGGYIDANLDPEGYRYQPLEADAWDFGARVRAGIEEDK